MGFLGKLLKTTIDIGTTPFDIVKDVATLGGSITDEESALVEKSRKLKKDLKQIRKAASKL